MIDQDPHSGEKVVKTADDLDKNLKKGIMNALRSVEKLARVRGIKLGERYTMRKILKRLLASGMDRADIAKIMGISLEKFAWLIAGP